MINAIIKKIVSLLNDVINVLNMKIEKDTKKKTKGYIQYHPMYKKIVRKAVGNKHCIKLNGKLYVKTKKCPKQLLKDLKRIKGMSPLTLKQAWLFTHRYRKTVIFQGGEEWGKL